MKKLKQIINQLKSLENASSEEYIDLLWPYICYSPQMPLRMNQEQLLACSSKEILSVEDQFFNMKNLNFPVYQWGNGDHIILLTHGWASKAADFSLLIESLKDNPKLKIIAFDAPGNGAAEGYLSNLLLYIAAVKTIIQKYGNPVIAIGHSLGGMANIAALSELKLAPQLIISLTPLVKLKAHFAASMDAIEIPKTIQQLYFETFENKFNMKATIFDLNSLYKFDPNQEHLLIYDRQDEVAPYDYLEEFLNNFPKIKKIDFSELGHYKMLKSTEINDLLISEISKIIK